MDLKNRLPFPAMAFRQFDQRGDLDCVVAVRATFMHVQDAMTIIAPRQEDFQWEDKYEGDPHETPLLRQTDLVPEKPGTDVTFLGNSFAPGGTAARSWEAELAVGSVVKRLSIYGERFWEPRVKEKWAGFSAREPKKVLVDWTLTEAEPTPSVPICWTHAFGGVVPNTGDPAAGVPADVERFNPAGCGIVDLAMPHDVGKAPAPQLTAPEEALDWRSPSRPEGFGLVPPWWRFRQQYAGTYDDNWKENRHPLLPIDFDPHFWQCAHPDLIATPHLKGGESYRLRNLHPTLPEARGTLPDLALGVHCERDDRDEWHVLRLDGVHFDWRFTPIVMLTWRTRFPLQEAERTTLTLTRVRVGSNDAGDNRRMAARA